MNTNPENLKEAGGARGSWWTAVQCALIPYLLATSFCFWIVLDDARNIPPVAPFALTVSVVLICIGLLHLVLRFVVRKDFRPEIWLTLIVGFTIFFGWFSSVMLTWTGANRLVAFFCWCLIFAVLSVVATNKHRTVASAFPLLFHVFAFILVVLSAQIGYVVFQDMRRLGVLEGKIRSVDIAAIEQNDFSEQQPDIYFLIFDAYARGDVLKDVYGFDNSPFLNELRSRGFHIGSSSRSNYHLTELSVASTLNLNYLQSFGLENFHTRMPVHAMMDDSVVGKFLKARGYETIALETGKNHTECTSFDRYVPTRFGFNDYQDALLSTTVFHPIFQLAKNSIPTPADLHRDRVLATFEKIKEVTSGGTQPKFVFSHLLSPHPPFVFDKHGEPVCLQGPSLLTDGREITQDNPIRTAAYREAYQQQLQFINSQILDLVDHIQANRRPTIIIMQSDHGPRSRFNIADGSNSDFHEGFGILNAIHLAGSEPSDLYPGITSVNTFRAILNHQFGTSLKMLDDRSYFEKDAYQFADVTEAAIGSPAAMSSSVLAGNRKQ